MVPSTFSRGEDSFERKSIGRSAAFNTDYIEKERERFTLKDPGRDPLLCSRYIKRRITRCPFQGVQRTGVCGKSSVLPFSFYIPACGSSGRIRASRGIIFAVLPIQLCVRRKAAFNKSLIKGKQRGRPHRALLFLRT